MKPIIRNRKSVSDRFRLIDDYMSEVHAAFEQTTAEKLAADELVFHYAPEHCSDKEYLQHIVDIYNNMLDPKRSLYDRSNIWELLTRYDSDAVSPDKAKVHPYTWLHNTYRNLVKDATSLSKEDPNKPGERMAHRTFNARGINTSVSVNEWVLEKRTNFVYDCATFVSHLREFMADVEEHLKLEALPSALDTSKVDKLKNAAGRLFTKLTDDLVGAPKDILNYFDTAKRSYEESFVSVYEQGFSTQVDIDSFIEDLKKFGREFILKLRQLILTAAENVSIVEATANIIYGNINTVITKLGTLVSKARDQTRTSVLWLLDKIKQSVIDIECQLDAEILRVT